MAMQNIKIRDIGHSDINLKERAADSKDEKGNDNGATIGQMKAFDRDILRGRDWREVNPADRAQVNWILSSVFIVEPRPAADMHDKPYSVLSGSHRTSWFERIVAFLRDYAKAETALAATSKGAAVNEHTANADDATAKAEAWLNFEVSCSIVHPIDDDERRAIVAYGNADEPASDTKVKQADESRMQAWYARMPKPEYMYQIDSTKKADDKNPMAQVRKVKGSEEGWSSSEYQNRTGVGGNARVSYSALTRLGQHFDLPVTFFKNRLKIKPEVTPSLLVKTVPVGEGSDRVSKLGYGLEFRYIVARAEAFGQPREALDAIKEAYKAEFLALMDATGDGSKALGNAPERTKAEKDEDKKRSEKEKEEADAREATGQAMARATYNFEKAAVDRLLSPNKPPMAACVGNAMDLLTIVPESKFTPEAIQALAAWKGKPTDEALIVAAVKAMGEMLIGTLPEEAPEATAPEATAPEATAPEATAPEATEQSKHAAHGKRNTKKSK